MLEIIIPIILISFKNLSVKTVNDINRILRSLTMYKDEYACFQAENPSKARDLLKSCSHLSPIPLPFVLRKYMG